jgi:hypothetical protein
MKISAVVFILLLLLTSGCEDNTTNPDSSRGNLLITSLPRGANIYLNGNDSRKITPSVFRGLDTGTVSVTLQLPGYKDTTFLQQVLSVYQITADIILTPLFETPDTVHFRGIKLYQFAYDNLGGLDLSTGQLKYAESPTADIYFDGSAGPRDLRSQHMKEEFLTNTTLFFNTDASNLFDGADSEFYEETNFSWIFHSNNNEGYSFLYDKEKHYSKLKVVEVGDEGPFFKFVIIDYIYNKNPNDPRF